MDNPDDYNIAVDQAYYRQKNLAGARRMPSRVGIRGTALGLAGLYDVHAPDRYPLLGKTSLPGYFLACGTSGAWFKGGPSIGALMAHIVTEQEGRFILPRIDRELDPAFFRPDRPPIETAFGSGVIG